MSFRHYLERVYRGLDRGQARQGKKPPRRLFLEPLESRTLLSVDFKNLADGLNVKLTGLDKSLDTIGSLNKLPVINRQLKDIDAARKSIQYFQTKLHDTLDGLGSTGSSDDAVKTALWDTLGPVAPGLNVLAPLKGGAVTKD